MSANHSWKQTVALPVAVTLVAVWALLSFASDFASLLTLASMLIGTLFLLLLGVVAQVLIIEGRSEAALSPERAENQHVQFSIGQLLFAVFFTSLVLAALRSLGGECAAALLLCVPALWLLYRAIARPVEAVAKLLSLHLFLAAYLTIGPILSYHLNGRAWYDYGMTGWNPPLSRNDDGKTWLGDYDPKFTPPATWPIIGPVMYTMCWLSATIVVCPPIAPVVAMLAFVLLWRTPTRHPWLLLGGWGIGMLPLIYLLVWGLKVLEWVAD